ncbi:MAG: lactonase family protein, partial [Verrucomicrobiota bacterium]|nr:lactonase family protein [Verrucomicrobiota bacterium]
MTTKRILHTTLAATSLTMTACAQTTRVYFGTSNSKGIYFTELDAAKGTLSEPKLAIEIGRPGFLAIHPNKQFIYSTTVSTGDGKNGGVAAMKINADGTLTLLNTQSSRGSGPCHVGIDATGQCLMVANYRGGSVASFRILEDGSLSEAQSFHQHKGSGAHPKRQDAPHAHSIFPNPGNTHAYASDLGIDKVMVYKLDPKAGTLAPSGFAEVPGGGMGPRHLKWSADGKVVYVLNELDLGISVFKPGKTDGSLEFIKTVSTLPEGADKADMTSAEIRIHPNGKFIYASIRDLTEQGRDTISVFTRFEDGFQRLETIPAQVWSPRNFNIDPTGEWMLAGGQQSHDIAIFKVDPKTGQL